MRAIEPTGWRGELHLRYERREQTTVLAARRHTGPVLVQKPLYPEGAAVCHGVVLHPPGGLVGGDRIALAASVGVDAHALLTTPGAGKWYRSAGPRAEQRLSFVIARGAALEWLPQATIVFNGALGEASTRVDIDPDGDYIGWEVLCLGRTAAGERFDEGEMLTEMCVARGGEPIWLERGRLQGGSRLLQSAAGFGGNPVSGTLAAVSSRVDEALVNACRTQRPHSGVAAVTRLPGVLIARYLGERSDSAHEYFVRLWQHIRPALIGRDACSPRIWRT